MRYAAEQLQQQLAVLEGQLVKTGAGAAAAGTPRGSRPAPVFIPAVCGWQGAGQSWVLAAEGLRARRGSAGPPHCSCIQVLRLIPAAPLQDPTWPETFTRWRTSRASPSSRSSHPSWVSAAASLELGRQHVFGTEFVFVPSLAHHARLAGQAEDFVGALTTNMAGAAALLVFLPQGPTWPPTCLPSTGG
jgi:hypothetical protein